MAKPKIRITVRDATGADLPIVAAFNSAMAAETEGKVLDHRSLERGVGLALGDRHRGRYFVAEIDGKIVGQTMVTFEWSDWRCGWFWWLQVIAKIT